MKNVSNGFKENILKSTRMLKAKVLINGSREITQENIVDFVLEQNLISNEEIVVGSTNSAKLDINFLGETILYTDFIDLYIGLEVNGVFEEVKMGRFYIDSVRRENKKVKVTAYDSIIKTEKIYTSSINYPCNFIEVKSELEKILGTKITGQFTDSQTIQKKIEGITVRQALGYYSSLFGAFCVADKDGNIEFKKISKTTSRAINGANFFNFKKEIFTHSFSRISCSVDGKELSYGSLSSDKFEMIFENPLITQATLNSIGEYYTSNDLNFTPASLKYQGDFSLELGDVLNVTDVDNKVYKLPILSQKFTFKGGLKCEINSVVKGKQKQEFKSSGAITQKIDRVVTEQALIKEAIIDKASIKDLEVERAKIDNLSAKNGEIENLLAGNLGSNNIQAGSITGDRINIDTLQVKSANIIDLTASSLKSGTLDTSKVSISSPNGKIVIADATQQFKDSSGNTRLQIGEDAKGNFSFSLMDSTGKGVLIDETGIKPNSIADGLIKNNMIGSNEIGGEKINIDSVISSINSNNNTLLNASKIKLDTENQSLNVAFSELKSSTKEATNKINNLQVGGANLFRETKEYNPLNPVWDWRTGPNALTDEIYNGCRVLKLTGQWGRVWQYVQVEVGKQYTFSAWVRKGDEETSPTLICDYGKVYTSNKFHNWSRGTVAPTEWTRIGVTFTINPDTDNPNAKVRTCDFRIEPYTADYSTNTPDLRICGLQLEEGNQMTSYKPSPLDNDYLKSSGVNLLWNSGNFTSTNHWKTYRNEGTYLRAKVENDVTYLESDVSAIQGKDVPLELGETYVCSAEIMFSGDVTVVNGNLKYGAGYTSPLTIWADAKDVIGVGALDSCEYLGKENLLKANQWHKVSLRFKVKDSYGQRVYFTPVIFDGSKRQITRIKNIQLEKGELVSDWKPSVYDLTQPRPNLIKNSRFIGGLTSQDYGFGSRTVEMKPFTTYTLSVNGRTNKTGTEDNRNLAVYIHGDSGDFQQFLHFTNTIDETQSVTFNTGEYSGNFTVISYLYPNTSATTSSATVNWYKLEEGNFPTDWTQNEDEIVETFETHKTEINVAKGKIDTLIADTTITKNNETIKLKDSFSSLEQTVNGISTNVSTLETSLVQQIKGIRYIRDYVNGNSLNTSNHWHLIQAYVGGVDVALGKNVTTSITPTVGTADIVTSGKLDANVYLALGKGKEQYVQVDLNGAYDLEEIRITHTTDYNRKYNSRVLVSTDGTSWITIYDYKINGLYKEREGGISYSLQSHLLQNGYNSSATQTDRQIKYRFNQAGAYNLLKNSTAMNGTEYWETNGGSRFGRWFLGKENPSFMSAFPRGFKYKDYIEIEPNTIYCYRAKFIIEGTITGSSTSPLHYWAVTDETASTKASIEILETNQNKTLTNGFHDLYMIFKSGADAKFFQPFIYSGTSNGTADICVYDILLTKSPILVGWSPHPNEIYSGVTTIDSNGVNVKHSAIETSTQLSAKGFVVNDKYGEPIAWLSSKETWTEIKADLIDANNINKIYRGKGTLYINHGFSGANPDGSADRPFSSFGELVYHFKRNGKIINAEITVNVLTSGFVADTLMLDGLTGSGKLNINFSTANNQQNKLQVILTNIQIPVRISGAGNGTTTGSQILGLKTTHTFLVRNCLKVEIAGFRAYGDTADYYFAYAENSYIALKLNDISKYKSMICLTDSSKGYSNANIGSNNVYQSVVYEGSIFGADSTIPMATYPSEVGSSGLVTARKVTPTASNYTAPNQPTTQAQIKTFNFTNYGYWTAGENGVNTNSWNPNGQTVYQGSWGYGNNAGFFTFDDVSIRSWLSNATVLDGSTITLRRASSGGYNTPQKVFLRGSTTTTLGSGTPIIGGTVWELGTLAWGEEKTFALPKQFVDGLKAGSVKSVCFYSSDGSNYIKFDAVCSMTLRANKPI